MRERRSEDFHDGIGRPVVKSCLIVVSLLGIAIITTLLTKNGDWFFYIMLGGTAVLAVFDKLIRPDKQAEKEAMKRWQGTKDDEPQ